MKIKDIDLVSNIITEIRYVQKIIVKTDLEMFKKENLKLANNYRSLCIETSQGNYYADLLGDSIGLINNCSDEVRSIYKDELINFTESLNIRMKAYLKSKENQLKNL